MSWKYVCNIDQIPENTLKQFEIDGISIVIANYGDGFRAFPPYCPHMEEPLAGTGLIEDGVLTCSKHLWQWNMSSCEKLGMAEKELLIYELKCDDDKILVSMEKELIYQYVEADDDDDDDFFD